MESGLEFPQESPGPGQFRQSGTEGPLGPWQAQSREFVQRLKHDIPSDSDPLMQNPRKHYYIEKGEHDIAAAAAAAQAAVAAVLANSPRLRPLMQSEAAKKTIEQLMEKTSGDILRPPIKADTVKCANFGSHVLQETAMLQESVGKLYSLQEEELPVSPKSNNDQDWKDRSPSISDLDAVDSHTEPVVRTEALQAKESLICSTPRREHNRGPDMAEYFAGMSQREAASSSGSIRKARSGRAPPGASKAIAGVSDDEVRRVLLKADGHAGGEAKGLKSVRHSLGKPQRQADKFWAGSLRGDDDVPKLSPRFQFTPSPWRVADNAAEECRTPNQSKQANGSPAAPNGHRVSPSPVAGKSPGSCSSSSTARFGSTSTPSRSTQDQRLGMHSNLAGKDRSSPLKTVHAEFGEVVKQLKTRQQQDLRGEDAMPWPEEKRRLHEVVDALTSAVKALQARCEAAESEADSLREELRLSQQQLAIATAAKQA